MNIIESSIFKNILKNYSYYVHITYENKYVGPVVSCLKYAFWIHHLR